MGVSTVAVVKKTDGKSSCGSGEGKRKRSGCLCCRKRKIKCDGVKPMCLRCKKGQFVCQWPAGGEGSLSHESNFQLQKTSGTFRFVNMNVRNEAVVNRVDTVNHDDVEGDVVDDDDDTFVRKYIMERTKVSISVTLSDVYGLCGLSSRERSYYNAFLNGFIMSISNQLAHEKLLPGSIIVPIGLFDPLIMKMCLLCGASFMSKCNSLMSSELTREVQNADTLLMHQLIERISNESVGKVKEWMLIYFVLRNARQKFVFEGRTEQTINMISGFQAIKLWIETETNEFIELDKSQAELETDIVSCLDYTNLNSYTLLDKLVDKRNKLLILNDDNSVKKLNVSAFERTLLDTFIFNYSCTLLTIDKSLINCMPSPFQVWNLLLPYLSVPIYECPVPWMNNPTVGAALHMIELQSKITWIARLSIYSESEMELIKRIQEQARCYETPVLPDDISTVVPRQICRKLQESCYISKLIALGIEVFALKLLNLSISEFDAEIVRVMDETFEVLKFVSLHSQTSVIGKWAYVVLGCAITKDSQRVEFRRRLRGFIEVLKTGSLRTSLVFLEKVWIDGIGLNALFLEEYLNMLVI